nr:MAG TPA: hypothetical protein [Caudoviricetes sp.]
MGFIDFSCRKGRAHTSATRTGVRSAFLRPSLRCRTAIILVPYLLLLPGFAA